MSTAKSSIQRVIRMAILNCADKPNMYNNIAQNLMCSRDTAKTIFFSFNYTASEEYLQAHLDKCEVYRKRYHDDRLDGF
jgi:hypothetical protein